VGPTLSNIVNLNCSTYLSLLHIAPLRAPDKIILSILLNEIISSTQRVCCFDTCDHQNHTGKKNQDRRKVVSISWRVDFTKLALPCLPRITITMYFSRGEDPSFGSL